MFYCHGYDFDGSDGVTDAELQTYYEAKTWPRELEGMAFTDAEIANLQTIERLEADRGSVYKDRGFHASDV